MGKTILITGSSRGIGAAIARLAHKQGYQVIVHGRTVSAELRAIHDELSGSIPTHFDVANKAETHKAITKLLERVGAIDVLVNNAGMGYAGISDVSEVDDEKAVEEYRVNVLGMLHCIQAVLPGMIKAGMGSVVSVSSIKGHYRLTTLSSLTYGITKAGVMALNQALAKAYAPIRFNTVSPGYVETDMAKGWSPDTFDRIKRETLAGRIAQPAEIAHVVMLLASDDAGYINGTDILADGGYAIKGK